jgi:hypothetical protein
MKRTRILSLAVTLVGMLVFSSGGFGAKGGIPGPPNNPGEESAGNRLSYPALLVPGISIEPFFMVEEGVLGDTYSYGCEGTETLEQFEYPNISCVDDLAEPTVYYTAEQCMAVGGKCEGKPVDRVYWQKEELNDWSAQATGVSDLESLPVTVRLVDWGDSIEVVNWNESSVLRVETQPFADLAQDALAELPEPPLGETQTQVGFAMWHVSGQGITEQWGVRVTEVAGEQGLPYVYASPYAIINAGTAELYLSKLFREAADDPDYACPQMGGDTPPVYPADYPFAGRVFTAGEGWSSACNLPVVAYTLEQSVSGKFVHGYNWRMRELTNPLPLADCGDTTWQKTGWWRLTFVPNGDADRMELDANALTAAPELPVAEPSDMFSLLAEESEDDTEGTLYAPVVSADDNLTYIDICIVKKEKGGGGGGGKGRR